MNKNGYIRKRFDEVFDLQMGKTPDRKNLSFFGGDNVWLSIRDMGTKYLSSSNECITDEAIEASGIKKVKKGTVVMSFKLTVGKCGIATCDLFTNEAIMAFNVKSNYNIKPDFLYFYLQGYKWQGANKAVMGLTLNKATISKQYIEIPPIEEQEAIVAELDEINEAIAEMQQQVTDLDALAQSMFYTMFGDPVTNEKGWDVKTIGDLFNVGSSKRVFEAQWRTSGVPFYRAREIVRLSKGEPIQDMIYIDQSLYDEYAKKYGVPHKGDMMVTGVGTLGICYLVESEEPFYFKDGNILWFRSINKCNTRFIRDQFNTDFVKQQIQFNANAAVVGTYTITNAKKTKVILPPMNLQIEYVAKVEAIESAKAELNAQIAEMQTLLASRMDYYFD